MVTWTLPICSTGHHFFTLNCRARNTAGELWLEMSLVHRYRPWLVSRTRWGWYSGDWVGNTSAESMTCWPRIWRPYGVPLDVCALSLFSIRRYLNVSPSAKCGCLKVAGNLTGNLVPAILFTTGWLPRSSNSARISDLASSSNVSLRSTAPAMAPRRASVLAASWVIMTTPSPLDLAVFSCTER